MYLQKCKGACSFRRQSQVRSFKSDHVFYNGAGNRMDTCDLLRMFYPVMRKAEVKSVRFHNLRHTWPRDSCRLVPISTPCKNSGDGRGSRWSCGTHRRLKDYGLLLTRGKRLVLPSWRKPIRTEIQPAVGSGARKPLSRSEFTVLGMRRLLAIDTSWA